ncbi:hypothetical protein M8818_000225 [Zalaria obscura]|uniref:Uncharacterized protein n=1 Tax=Zalaria obscura TaxID=2024903 RepID=A0ACC3SPF3_9PEZI
MTVPTSLRCVSGIAACSTTPPHKHSVLLVNSSLLEYRHVVTRRYFRSPTSRSNVGLPREVQHLLSWPCSMEVLHVQATALSSMSEA